MSRLAETTGRTGKTRKAEILLTPAAERAIGTLVHNPGIPAQKFGLLMWPDSPHHQRWQGRAEQGIAKGRVMWLKAGSYLWHLKRKGLVRYGALRSGHGAVWYATEEGKRLLEDSVERRQTGKEQK